MAEKRRGLGRGLGALIPSSAEPEEIATSTQGSVAAGRPVDLFFAAADEPRTSSAAGPRRGAGINKEALRGPAKKSTTRSSAPRTAARAAGAQGAAEEVATVPSVRPKATDASGTAAAKRAVKASRGAAARQSRSEAGEAPEGPMKAVQARTESDAASGAAISQESAVSADETAVGSDVSRETLGSDPQSSTELVQVPGATFAELAIDSIHPNRKQPRSVFDEDDMAELVHSIREIGVLQPIVVRPSPEDDAEHPYELVMGERRWRASRAAGLDAVPAIIRSTQDVDLLRDALLENLHRSQLNPLEEAAAYQQLLDDFECSHEELADRIGRSRPQVTNTLRLMKLPPLVQRRLAAGILSAGHARALLGLGDPAEMEKLAQKIVAEGLSVRATEEIVSLADGIRKPAKSAKPKLGARHERLDYLATSLSDRLDTNVKITLGARKGKVSIEFASVDDLNRIMGVLTPTVD
ncbi:ParB/RepB/Spo0J family partition protein [Arthrobacter sp. zg-Y1143]|uniref:ParB/RepB/Spo0J family partition protein n=1 Tax=Arthrobacter sp. zg-Y1143 TaxID=3049065 RepID=UPI0024C35EFF|nr:ParB/RepB/Spo0J family partition protein [Arthrobacter sp. zg-Y1143]MDK1326239.1 ParB/RepB/Spo0J family partition protein [Arthrobacter sp. zg-Y1143]